MIFELGVYTSHLPVCSTCPHILVNAINILKPMHGHICTSHIAKIISFCVYTFCAPYVSSIMPSSFGEREDTSVTDSMMGSINLSRSMLVLATLHVHIHAYRTHTTNNTRTEKTLYARGYARCYYSPAHPSACIIHCTLQ